MKYLENMKSEDKTGAITARMMEFNNVDKSDEEDEEKVDKDKKEEVKEEDKVMAKSVLSSSFSSLADMDIGDGD